jgi:hypothetical protein
MAAIKTYKEFWPYYAGEHAHPTCRRLHFIGTTIVMAFAVAALVTRHYWLFAMMPVAGYGFAWVGHFGVEKNRPATFTYPFWSLGSDFVLWWKMATFQMDAELAKLGIAWVPPESRPSHRAR